MLLRSFLLIVVLFCGGLQMMSNPSGATRTDDGGSSVERRRRLTHRSTTGATGDDCTRVAASFVRITGHDSHTMPSQKINDGDLEVCQMFGQHKTCCTRLMERRLHQAAMEDMRDIIASTSQHLKDLLVTNSELYENEFLKLLSAVSNNDTRLLLSLTYKIPSDEIDVLVGKLFDDLRSFMQHNADDIRTSVAAFFDSLFSTVYIYTINESDGSLVPDDQRSCLKSARKDLIPAPFSEAIQQLNQDLIRSLGVARSLLDAFELAIEVINTTDHLHFEHQCSRGIARLLYCSYCDGHLDVRPCRNFCMNVAHGCLAQVVELNAHWNLFVDAVEKLVLSMRGSFDLQDVMTLFHSRISDSIMLTVANTQKYHSQVVPRCGSLVRVSSNTTAPHQPSNGSHRAHGQPTTRSSEVKLHRKIEMFVKNLADSRGFYEKLPDTVCSSEKLSAGNYDSCWNGTSLGMYTKPVPVQEFSAQVAENPEMRVPDSKQSVILSLSEKLDNMTKILHSRVIPKPPPMQSDESSRDFLVHSGDGQVSSGDGSEGGDDDEDEDSETESGSSSGGFSEPAETQPTGPGSRDGSRGAGSGVIVVTNTDFDFTEKTSMKSHSPYVTKVQQVQPDVVTVIYTGTGSMLKFPCYGSLLATFSILIVVCQICW